MELFPKLPPEKRRLMLTVAVVTLGLVLLAAVGQSVTLFLRTQVAAPADTQRAIVGGLLDTSQLTPGEHTLTFEARTRGGEPVRAARRFVVATPPGPPPSPTPPVSGGEAGGGSGGSAGGGTPQQAAVHLSHVRVCSGLEPNVSVLLQSYELKVSWEVAEPLPLGENVMLLIRPVNASAWLNAGNRTPRQSLQLFGSQRFRHTHSTPPPPDVIVPGWDYEIAFQHQPSGLLLPNTYRFTATRGRCPILEEGSSRRGPWSFAIPEIVIQRLVRLVSGSKVATIMNVSPTTRQLFVQNALPQNTDCDGVLTASQASSLEQLVTPLKALVPVDTGPQPANLLYDIGFPGPSPSQKYILRVQTTNDLPTTPIDFRQLDATVRAAIQEICGIVPTTP